LVSLLLTPLSPSLTNFFFFLLLPLPPRSTLFPYTTLFRSLDGRAEVNPHADDGEGGGEEPLGRQTPECSGARSLCDGDAHLRSGDRKSTRLNSSHVKISYAVFCLKKKIPFYSQSPV